MQPQVLIRTPNTAEHARPRNEHPKAFRNYRTAFSIQKK